jgi:hypothetical protein
VLAVCNALGATRYINSIGGRQHSIAAFAEHGVELKCLQPRGVTYRQFSERFVPSLSIVDAMMFNSKRTVQAMLGDAALALAVIDCVSEELRYRRAVIQRYREQLEGIAGLTAMQEPAGVDASYQYFVVRIDPVTFGCSRDVVFERLKLYNVFGREYFYPLCSEHDCYRDLPSSAPGLLPRCDRGCPAGPVPTPLRHAATHGL